MGSHSGQQNRSLDDVWIVLPLVLPTLVALVAPLGTIDLAYHLRLGADILSSGSVVEVDTFTFAAAGEAWTDQQWLAQVVFELVHRAGSWSGLAIVGAVLIGAAGGLTAASCRARAASVRTSAVLALAAFLVAAPMLAVRPQLIGVATVAFGVWVVATRERRPTRLWLLPACAAFLANVHGSFPIVVLLAVLAAGEDLAGRRRWWRVSAAAAVATALATLLNPFGVGVWGYAVDIATNPVIRTQITEWAPLSLGRATGVLVVLSVIGVVAVGVVRRARVRAIDVIWLVVFLVPTIASERAGVWWALTFPVVLAGWLAIAGTTPALVVRPSIRPPVLVGSVVLLTLALPAWRDGPGLDDAPPGATAAVANLPDGTRAFVQQTWGSWFEFATPDVLTYVDSRIELFPAEVWDRYGAIASGDDDASELLGTIGADTVAGEPTWPLVLRLRDDAAWRTIYDGPDGVVLVRA